MTLQDMQIRLKQAFPDAEIEVIDLTGTQDHWEVFVSSTLFTGDHNVFLRRESASSDRNQMIHGQIIALKLLLTMIANALPELLTPPERLSHLFCFGAFTLCMDLGVQRSHGIDIPHYDAL